MLPKPEPIHPTDTAETPEQEHEHGEHPHDHDHEGEGVLETTRGCGDKCAKCLGCQRRGKAEQDS